MKNLFLAILIICCTQSQAQVGIGIDVPDASSQLDIVSNAKGILIPRMTEVERMGIGSPATGLLVYQINVVAGFYVYNGSSWQLLLDNSKGYLPLTGGTITGGLTGTTSNFSTSTTSPVLIGGTGTTSSLIYKTTTGAGTTGADHIFVVGNNGSTEAMRILNNGNVGVGVSNPSVILDARSAALDGAIGIGTSAQTPAGAGSGAVRYSTSSGGTLQYSNGTAWNTLSSTVQKSLVAGYFSGTYANSYYGNITCTESDDVNNDFAGNTFTVPRTGYYTFTFAGSTDGSTNVTAKGDWEMQVVPSTGSSYVSRFYCPVAVTAYIIGVNGAYSVRLTSGTTVTFKLFQSTGFSQTFATQNYNRFSIVEN